MRHEFLFVATSTSRAQPEHPGIRTHRAHKAQLSVSQAILERSSKESILEDNCLGRRQEDAQADKQTQTAGRAIGPWIVIARREESRIQQRQHEWRHR